jgi:hypothetical protein
MTLSVIPGRAKREPGIHNRDFWRVRSVPVLPDL